MLKNTLYVLLALLASTTVTAQTCPNKACDLANSLYTECKYSYTTIGDFQKCLCTPKFLNNYDRCLAGTICVWYSGGPSNDLCPAVYCPGPFVGGFDAKAFCSGSLPLSTLPTPTQTSSVTPIGTEMA